MYTIKKLELVEQRKDGVRWWKSNLPWWWVCIVEKNGEFIFGDGRTQHETTHKTLEEAREKAQASFERFMKEGLDYHSPCQTSPATTNTCSA